MKKKVTDALAREVSDAFIALRRPDRSARRGGSDHDLTPAQGEVVYLVERAGSSGATTGSLAKTLGVSSSAVTQLVDTLVERGLLIRVADADDRRVIRIELTAEGRRLYTLFDDARVESTRKLLAPLSAQEARTLGDLLTKLTQGRTA